MIETNREEVRIKAERRVMKFEESTRTSTDGLTQRECSKENDRNVVSKEREEHLRQNSYSQQRKVKLGESGEDTATVLELTTKNQEQEQFNEIRNTKCNAIHKFIVQIGLPGCLERRGRWQIQKLTVRAVRRQEQVLDERRWKVVRFVLIGREVKKCKHNTIYKFIGKIGLAVYPEGRGRGESRKLTTRARRGNLKERNKYRTNEDGKLCDLCLLEEFMTSDSWDRGSE